MIECFSGKKQIPSVVRLVPHLVVSFSSSILLFLGSLSFPWVPRDLLLTTSQTPLNLTKASRGPWRPLAPSVDSISVCLSVCLSLSARKTSPGIPVLFSLHSWYSVGIPGTTEYPRSIPLLRVSTRRRD